MTRVRESHKIISKLYIGTQNQQNRGMLTLNIISDSSICLANSGDIIPIISRSMPLNGIMSPESSPGRGAIVLYQTSDGQAAQEVRLEGTSGG